jgi:hypothetical protein
MTDTPQGERAKATVQMIALRAIRKGLFLIEKNEHVMLFKFHQHASKPIVPGYIH